ncbi:MULTISPECIES: hypothetical protein [unclassified Tatumella]|uniref:virion core protein, T7 gp14 family n=1 Tax=unclassified Tatumella TaxID=2649542 RepID=UPI001BB07A07|nr:MULTISPECIES: hypothetical protein [unclassified Tatumella]MBS0878863.1 hypothetical protein [Tatumella sp. JGM82]MBS0892372.1 hypothetical protein [Tatumella sp. JGM94]MBS0903461.1 hypothetical protein [Tatumella sp. JGM100]
MCSAMGGGIAGGVFGTVSGIMANKQAADIESARVTATREQAIEYVKQNNYTQNNLNLEDRDNYDNLVQAMTNNNLQGYQKLGSLNTAISESGIQGNSVNRLRSSVTQSTDNNTQNLYNQYQQQYSKIYGEKLSSQLQTKSEVDSLDQSIHNQSNFSQFMGVLSSTASGAASGYQIGTGLSSAMKLGSTGTGTSSLFGTTSATTSGSTGAMNLSTDFSSYL